MSGSKLMKQRSKRRKEKQRMRSEQVEKSNKSTRRIKHSDPSPTPPGVRRPVSRRITTQSTGKPKTTPPKNIVKKVDLTVKKIPMITINGMTYTNDSFSICTRGFAIGFLQNGCRVSIDAWSNGSRTLPIEEEVRKAVSRGSDRKIGIRISHPNTFQILDNYEFGVGFGVCETQALKEKWVDICNTHCDQVWTPSTFSSEVYREYGINNVFTVPNGFDPRYMNKEVPPMNFGFPKGTFVFLTVGNAQDRKGTEMLYQAFREEFNRDEPVGLVIKSYAPWAWGLCQYAGNGLIKPEIAEKHNVRIFNDKRVYGFGKVEEYWDEKEQKHKLHLVQNDVPFTEMGGLYTASDCFVLPTKGEGFGLPILEAKACEVPVITTNWSGHLDFCDNTDTFLLEYTGFSKAFEQHDWQGYWVDPDYNHLKYLLRFVYENRAMSTKKAKLAYQRVHKGWTWKESAKKGIKALSLEFPDIWIEEIL